MGVPNMNAAYEQLDRTLRATFAEAMAGAKYGARSGPLMEEVDIDDTAVDYNLLLDNFGFRKLKKNPPKKAVFEKRVTIYSEEWIDNITVPERDLNSKHGDKYRLQAKRLGKQVPRFIDGQVARLLTKDTGAAFTENSWDGVPFFSGSHPMTLAGDNAASAFSNYDSDGSGNTWYLFDTSLIAPIVWQWKQRPEARDFGPDSEYCRDNFEVKWNFYTDCGIGMSLWHFAYASDNTLNEENFVAARAAMQKVPTYERIEGAVQYMGVMPNLLVVGNGNQYAAEKLLNQLNLASGESNTLYKAIDLLVLPMLA